MSAALAGLCALHRLPLRFLYCDNQKGQSTLLYACNHGCRVRALKPLTTDQSLVRR